MSFVAIRDFVEERGHLVALVLAAVVLFAGLGRPGLWEPWEMDRADLARTMVEPGQVAAALESGDSALHATLADAAAEAGLVVRDAQPEATGARTATAGARQVREALDRARTEIVAAVVIDGALIGEPRAGGVGLGAAWNWLSEALKYTPNGKVIVLWPDEGLDRAAVDRQIAVARIRTGYEDLRKLVGLPAFEMPPASDPAWDPAIAVLTPPPGLVHLTASQRDELASALREAGTSTRRVVQFKDAGETLTAAPLGIWLTAGFYRAFGISEFTSRLGGALLGWLTVLVLALAARRHFGGTVALLAGIVLITTPLFFAEARSVASNTGATLAVTLIGAGLLEHARRSPAPTVYVMLILGAVLGLFAAGLTVLLIGAVMATSVALVSGARRADDWAPAILLATILAVAAVWVLRAPPDGFAGQLRFTQPLFTEGPSAYARNFDYAVKRIGFGTFPWSAAILVAFGSLAWRSTHERQGESLVLVVWLAVPAIATMGLLKGFNQTHFTGPAAVALGVALFLRQLVERGLWSRVVAFFVLLTTIILWKELSTSPQPLADLLAYDPPFADKPGQRFPSDVHLSKTAMLLVFLLSGLLLVHVTRLVTALSRLAGWFRREGPASITAGIFLVLLPLMWLARVLGKYATGMNLDTANALSADQRVFASSFLLSTDPAVLLAWVMLAMLGLVLLSEHLGPRLLLWGRGYVAPRENVSILGLPFRSIGVVSAYATRVVVVLPARGLRRVVVAVQRPVGARRALLAAAALLAVAAGVMLASVSWPDGYWAETFGHPATAGVLVVAVALLVATRRSSGDLLTAVAAASIPLTLALAARLSRDADLRPTAVTVLVLLAAVALCRALVPRLARDLPAFAREGGLLGCAALFALTLPLLDRWDQMAPLLYPDAAENLTRYLLFESRTTALAVLVIVGVVLNAVLPRAMTARLGRLAEPLERGPAAAFGLVSAALVFTALAAGAFYPTLSEHVSQKHVLQTYREAEGLSAHAMGDRIIRHGSFGTPGRKDSNFYTADIPEVRDRQTALRVLLGQTDTPAAVETSTGSVARVFPGWDPANDANGDGRRDYPVERGVATAVGPGRLVDDTRSWAPDSLVGRVLVDADGKQWKVTGNDATSLTLEGPGVPSFSPTVPQRSAYTLDDARAPVHTATAEQRQRYYTLLPAENFSELNHAFRELSGGRHVPVLDGRSSRVLLGASWLLPGEENQNRYAAHTMTRAEFDALEDPSVHRGWANFEDKIRVLGYRLDEEVVSRGKTYKLSVYYEAIGDIRTSYKIFMHIDRQGSSNRIHGDHWPLNLPGAGTEGEEQGKICVGCYRTDHWMPGDVVVDVYEGEVPVGTPSGPQDIWIGFYTPGSDERLKVKNWDEGRVKHDGQNRVRVGTLQVR
ncbi:MAG: glycosyltransferase family 39 protein [Deltaproteobacteria bacterium]|nr:glycosyltransferase family 39 protein [Deltaproteobacteria bacterium]MCB9788441.1 glycosyltransferase family 39 protein [Deltaproteobacteria bacterium]